MTSSEKEIDFLKKYFPEIEQVFNSKELPIFKIGSGRYDSSTSRDYPVKHQRNRTAFRL